MNHHYPPYAKEDWRRRPRSPIRESINPDPYRRPSHEREVRRIETNPEEQMRSVKIIDRERVSQQPDRNYEWDEKARDMEFERRRREIDYEMRRQDEDDRRRREEEEVRKIEEMEIRRRKEEEVRRIEEMEIRRRKEEEVRRIEEMEIRRRKEEEVRRIEEMEIRRRKEEEVRRIEEMEIRRRKEEEVRRIEEMEIRMREEDADRRRREEDEERRRREDAERRRREESARLFLPARHDEFGVIRKENDLRIMLEKNRTNYPDSSLPAPENLLQNLVSDNSIIHSQVHLPSTSVHPPASGLHQNNTFSTVISNSTSIPTSYSDVTTVNSDLRPSRFIGNEYNSTVTDNDDPKEVLTSYFKEDCDTVAQVTQMLIDEEPELEERLFKAMNGVMQKLMHKHLDAIKNK